MSRLFTFLFLIFCLVTLEPVSSQEKPDSAQAKSKEDQEAQKIIGTWREISREYQGILEKKLNPKSKLIFQAEGKFTLIDGFTVQRTYQLDTTKNPKTIDMIDTIIQKNPQGNKKIEFRHLGIYQIKDDQLTICYIRHDGPKAGKRPTEFKGKPKSGIFLSVYQREKE